MSYLLVGATNFEIDPFLKIFNSKKDKSFAGCELDVLITGIGLMSCTYALMKQLRLRRPQFIIQAGIGGCFNKDLSLGEVVAISKDTVADLGVMEKKEWQSVFDMGFARQNNYPFKKKWLVNSSEIFKEIMLPKVSAISVNEITTSSLKIKEFRRHYDPVVESLEGAALHYVALMENIPFLQIRGLSNYIGERDKSKWKIKEAVHNLNEEIVKTVMAKHN